MYRVVKRAAAALFFPGAAPPQVVVAVSTPPEGVHLRVANLSREAGINAAFKRQKASVKRFCAMMESVLPLACCAAIIASHSSSEAAIGFRTAHGTRAQGINTDFRMNISGVQTSTISRSGSDASICSWLSYTRASVRP
jgi:hypothetical protein